MALHFPNGFLWGASTAAHQVEGNNTNSDFWLMENLEGSTFKEPSGSAVDHYRLYREDITRFEPRDYSGSREQEGDIYAGSKAEISGT